MTFSDIAAAHQCNISVAQGRDGSVYMWGQVKSPLLPLQTSSERTGARPVNLHRHNDALLLCARRVCLLRYAECHMQAVVLR